MRRLASVLVAILWIATGPAQASAPAPLHESFDLRVGDTPQAVRTDVGTQVFYELHLTNFSAAPLRLRALEVKDAQDGRVLASFSGAALEQRFVLLAGAAPAGGALIPPGRRGVLYLEWPVHGQPPRTLEHAVTYTEAAGGEARLVHGARTAVSDGLGAPLGPPLRGGPWVAIHQADWPRGHRRVFNTVDGKARIPGRFAVDWVRVDAGGHLTQGDPDVPAHALGYGAEVLAVADATVAAVHDGMAEAPSVAGNPRHALEQEAGNYVVLRLGDGRYAFYEHLRPGSVTVKPGQRVARGAVLGQLGFTGDSTGPHLHFHVADGPATVGAEGRPFVFARFELLGRYSDIGTLDEAPWTPRPREEAATRRDEWPAENAVVRFAD